MKHKLQNTQIPPLLKKTKQTPLKKKHQKLIYKNPYASLNVYIRWTIKQENGKRKSFRKYRIQITTEHFQI